MVNKISRINSVLLVGLGGIACSYDYEDSASYVGQSKTHLTAATGAGLKVVGGIDLDESARRTFEKHTKLVTWRSIDELPSDLSVDLVVVSTPSQTHKAVIDEIVGKIKPLAIICEKPFGNSKEDSKYIIELLANKKIPLLVNYTREYSKSRNEITKYFNSDNFVTGSFTYSHGLRRSGSHFIRLITGLLGEPISIEKIPSTKKATNPSFKLNYSENRSFSFIGIETIEFRVANGLIELTDRILTIQEGNHILIQGLPSNKNSPFWSSEGKTLFDSNLDGGLDEIYVNLSWTNSNITQSLSNKNAIDHVCNVIMDEVLSSY